MTRIEDIARRQHQTGAYGGTYLRMGRSTFDVLAASWGEAPVHNGWDPVGAADAMRAIRIVVDDGIADGHWRLIDVKTGVPVLSGEIDSEQVSA